MRNKSQTRKEYSKFNLFFLSIQNEIAVDRELLERTNKNHFSFVPVRSLKSIPILERFKVGNIFYCLLSLAFAFFLPLVIFFQFIFFMFSHRPRALKNISGDILLVANGRAHSIFYQEFLYADVTTIDVNQNDISCCFSLRNLVNVSDIFKTLIDSFFGFLYFLIKDKNISNIPQLYVTFSWFLSYHSMKRISGDVKSVYFSNHYDRWAVLFDQVFSDKWICLLQHGILPEKLELPYKLKNLNVIFAIDGESELKFSRLFDLSQTVEFHQRSLHISLVGVEHCSESVLIIGQPHSVKRELALIDLIGVELPQVSLFIKPHPLYGKKQYEATRYGEIISENEYYPMVDVAVCLESTLGVEYERAGVEVLWWHNASPEKMMIELKKRFDKLQEQE